MLTSNVDMYVKIALDTGVFRDCELEILKELLEDHYKNKNSSYLIFEDKKQNDTTGFIIFGKTPLTEFCWDIYWLVVNKRFQRQGIGRILFEKAQDFILEKTKKAILRVETSTREDYIPARDFYKKIGFEKAGYIPDFYAYNDGLVVFSKTLKLEKTA